MKEFDLDIMLGMLHAGEPFSYARYGDGEWNAILQKKPGGHNCDGHEYFPDLGKALQRILASQPGYFLGLQNLAREQNTGHKLFDWLVAKNRWVENEIIHRASIKGRLNEFLQAIEGRKVFLVGNESLSRLKIPLAAFIQIPEHNCWSAYARVKSSISELVKPGDIILYCASMMSKVLVDDFCNEGLTQIDCGSVFDPYVGKMTRSYHKTLNIELPG